MPFTKRIIAGSTLITLLPILFGAMLYHRLPDRMPTHFAADGSVTETMPKLVVVFARLGRYQTAIIGAWCIV